MQITSKTIRLTGTEKSDLIIAHNVQDGLVFVLENRGPGVINIFGLGPIEPNRFVVIGSAKQLKYIHRNNSRLWMLPFTPSKRVAASLEGTSRSLLNIEKRTLPKWTLRDRAA